jgi:hypothetical protein
MPGQVADEVHTVLFPAHQQADHAADDHGEQHPRPARPVMAEQ